MSAPLAVEMRLLRALLAPDAPELKLAPGRAMMARVVTADGTGRGALSIAGAIVDAELPKHIRGGEDLRLVVREVTAERVLLQLADPGVTAGPPPPVPLPGGGTVRRQEDRESGGTAGARTGAHTLALRYDAPALGVVDLRFDLDAGALRVSVAVASGDPLEAATGKAGTLRDALAAAVPRTVSVTVTPRREPLDVYA